MDGRENLYIVGYTQSSSGIATSGAFYSKYIPTWDNGLIAQFSKTGDLLWGSYFGNFMTECYGVAADQNAHVFVTGTTRDSTIATSGAYHKHSVKGPNCFIASLWGGKCTFMPAVYGPHSTCLKDLVTYHAEIHAGNNYSWKALGGTIQSMNNTDSIKVLWTRSGNDTLWLYEKSPLCSDSVYIIVNINLDNTVSHKKNIICNGDSISIGLKFQSSDAKYSWTSSSPGFTSTSFFITVDPSKTIEYYLNSYDTIYGCSYKDTFIVVVNDPPTASVGKPTKICLGDSIQLGGSFIHNHSYYWSSKPAGFTSMISDPVVAPVKTTQYYLAETNDSTGCSSIDSVIIVVNPKPIAVAGYNTTICQDESVTLGSAAVSGYSYAWTSVPSGFTAYSANPIVTPSKTSTYYLTASNTATGCSATDSVTITVHTKPSVSAYDRTINVCAGSVNTLALTTDSSFTKDTVLYTYSWHSAKANVLLNPHKDTVAIGWNDPGVDTAWVTVSNKYGCKDSARFIVTVHAVPNAHFNVSSNGDVYTFKAGDSTLKGYTWSFGDSSSMDSGHSASHVFGHNRSYKVTLVTANSFGCVSTYDSTISITASGLEEDIHSDNTISIYPNPFSNVTNIFYSLQNPSQVSIEVLDMQGRKVATLATGNQPSGSHSCEFDAGKYNCSAGIYLVKVLIADQVAVRRIVRID